MMRGDISHDLAETAIDKVGRGGGGKPIAYFVMSKMVRYIMPHGQKIDVIDIMFNIERHLYIT